MWVINICLFLKYTNSMRSKLLLFTPTSSVYKKKLENNTHLLQYVYYMLTKNRREFLVFKRFTFLCPLWGFTVHELFTALGGCVYNSFLNLNKQLTITYLCPMIKISLIIWSLLRIPK